MANCFDILWKSTDFCSLCIFHYCSLTASVVEVKGLVCLLTAEQFVFSYWISISKWRRWRLHTHACTAWSAQLLLLITSVPETKKCYCLLATASSCFKLTWKLLLI